MNNPTHFHPETLLRLTGPTAERLRIVAESLDDDKLANVVLLNVDRTWSTIATDELFARITN